MLSTIKLGLNNKILEYKKKWKNLFSSDVDFVLQKYKKFSYENLIGEFLHREKIPSQFWRQFSFILLLLVVTFLSSYLLEISYSFGEEIFWGTVILYLLIFGVYTIDRYAFIKKLKKNFPNSSFWSFESVAANKSAEMFCDCFRNAGQRKLDELDNDIIILSASVSTDRIYKLFFRITGGSFVGALAIALGSVYKNITSSTVFFQYGFEGKEPFVMLFAISAFVLVLSVINYLLLNKYPWADKTMLMKNYVVLKKHQYESQKKVEEKDDSSNPSS